MYLLFPSLSESSGFLTLPYGGNIELIHEMFPSLSESSGFLTVIWTKNKYRSSCSSFHLFQRVVGFRLIEFVDGVWSIEIMFPSLSESSGFPTYVHYGDEIDPTLFPSLSESSGFPTFLERFGIEYRTTPRFHLFQRVVGFRHWKRICCWTMGPRRFPSLSESSGFPTCIIPSARASDLSEGFHLFQRVVGFRLLGFRLRPESGVIGFHLFQRVVGFRPSCSRLFQHYLKTHVSISFRE